MNGQVKPIPEGYHTITPYLCVKDASGAIEFYKKAFSAIETECMKEPSGKIAHADLIIGNSHVMLSDEYPDMGVLSPQSLGGTAVQLMVYVEDVDSMVTQAVAAGAKLVREIEVQFYGDRAGQIEDPFGYRWFIATHIEDVSSEEMDRRMQQMGTEA